MKISAIAFNIKRNNAEYIGSQVRMYVVVVKKLVYCFYCLQCCIFSLTRHSTQLIRPFHILIVEDNEGDVLLIQEALQQWSIAVKTSVVRDGGDAIDFLEKNGMYQNAEAPDIILLDVNLPKVNGHEVLKYIKGTLANIQIPVIMLTTSSSKNDIDLAYKNYANCYISKPVEVDQFFEIFSAIEGFWVNCVRLPLNQQG